MPAGVGGDAEDDVEYVNEGGGSELNQGGSVGTLRALGSEYRCSFDGERYGGGRWGGLPRWRKNI